MAPEKSNPTKMKEGESIKLKVLSSSKKKSETFQVGLEDSVKSLKELIFKSNFDLRVNRQRLTIPSAQKGQAIVLADEKSISSYNLHDGDSLILKDLGPQISWRTVFILEYLGPLLIHQLMFLPRLSQGMSFTQILAYACVTFHFAKREYETIFVHRFSHSTMPLRNLFKNCLHYWVFSGFLIAWNLYRQNFVSPSIPIVLSSMIVFIAAELGNFYTHALLRNLRPDGSTVRAIPRGFGFNLVSCPNYSFEILAWIAFSVMTGLWSSWIFTVIATAQMWIWAVKKHKQYRKEFPSYPKSRKILIPFLL